MMYLRIFPAKRFRLAVYIVIGFTVTYTLVAVLLTVFSCNPIDKAWNKTEPGTCIDSRTIWYCMLSLPGWVDDRNSDLADSFACSHLCDDYPDRHHDHRAAHHRDPKAAAANDQEGHVGCSVQLGYLCHRLHHHPDDHGHAADDGF
jgi:hypothetical protein